MGGHCCFLCLSPFVVEPVCNGAAVWGMDQLYTPSHLLTDSSQSSLPNLLQTLLSVCLEPSVWEIKEVNSTHFPDAWFAVLHVDLFLVAVQVSCALFLIMLCWIFGSKDSSVGVVTTCILRNGPQRNRSILDKGRRFFSFFPSGYIYSGTDQTSHVLVCGASSSRFVGREINNLVHKILPLVPFLS
jgi:hypothetical protein